STMGQLFGVAGEMSESDRHALMQHALRAKHLRFLRDQKTDQVPNGAGESNEQLATAATKPQRLPSSSEVLRDGPRDIGNGLKSDTVGEQKACAERDQAQGAGRNLAQEVSEILHLRRLLEPGELTQEEYLSRLHWL